MNLKKFLLMFAMIFTLIFNQAAPCYALMYSGPETSSCDFYAKDGIFVNAPASIGMVAGMTAGITTQIVLFPVIGPNHFLYVVGAPAVVLGYAAGFPFFIVKKVGYDAPKTLFKRFFRKEP